MIIILHIFFILNFFRAIAPKNTTTEEKVPVAPLDSVKTIRINDTAINNKPQPTRILGSQFFYIYQNKILAKTRPAFHLRYYASQRIPLQENLPQESVW